MQGRTLSQAKEIIQKEISIRRQELDSLAAETVENGVVFREAMGERQERLIKKGSDESVRKRSGRREELGTYQTLFNDLERKQDIAEFLDLTEQSDGVRIFICSENKTFFTFGFIFGCFSL